MNQTIKLWERVTERRLRNMVHLSDKQFGFRDSRNMHHLHSKTDLQAFIFIDLDKAGNDLPREAI